MSLVAYDVSDISDEEEEEEKSGLHAVPTNNNAKHQNESEPRENKGELKSSVTEFDQIEGENSDLFSVVPTPKPALTVLDSDRLSKLLLNKPSRIAEKSSKKTVKIAIPALSELDEDLPRPLTKKIIAPVKGSGLFSLLPPPKNSGQAASIKLMPDSLKRKIIPKPIAKPVTAPLPLTPIVTPSIVDDESDDESGGDFFSLNEPREPIGLTQETLPADLPQAEFVSDENEPVPDRQLQPNSSHDYYETGDFVPVASDNIELDEEALQKLCGGNKRKRNAMQAQLIDVSEKDVVPDQSEWLMKTLTEEKRTRSHKKGGGPSTQQKKKHQITYLAFQAKEQEQELQNQWANNRMTKKQTQSKYGF